jgi:prepilin-type N-terminal cleavage/methylation domain-containing protein
MQQKGFTLIELLIVIALLGALAVGLLATVDPFEQLKKGNDTSTRNTASELYNSFIRFYASKNAFPWSTDIVAMPANNFDMTDEASTGHILKVVTAGELKSDFVKLAGSGSLGSIFVTSEADVATGARQNVAVCFLPGSKSFQLQENTKYDSDGQDGTNCKSTDGASDCYWCIK